MWSQIADRLRAAPERQEFKAGDRLPSEADLNHAFGVSRSAARAALDKLESEGRIVRRIGKGSIVLSRRVDQPLNLLPSFADDMSARGQTPSYLKRAMKILNALREIAGCLQIEAGTLVDLIADSNWAAVLPDAIAYGREDAKGRPQCPLPLS